MDDKAQLLELYEATGDPDAFTRAKPLYEQALAGPEASDPNVRLGYGYLLECHGRYSLRQATEQYERAIELDPDADKPRYQLIGAQAALGEPRRRSRCTPVIWPTRRPRCGSTGSWPGRTWPRATTSRPAG